MIIKHSKYKNTGILFELLTRRVAMDTLAGNINSDALRIIENFFSKRRELGKELILYRSFFNSKQLSEAKALDFINTLIEQRKKLNVTNLKTEKYELVKEIKNVYPEMDSFLSIRVPSYKIYASIYKNFECAAKGYTFENVEELSEAKYTLVEYLCGKINNKKQIVETEIMTLLKEQEEDIRLLSMKLLLEKFNSKYENLNIPQKKLLREFLSRYNKKDMLVFVKNESTKLAKSINSKLSNITNDVQRIKLEEVIRQLHTFDSLKNLKNNHLTALMIGYELNEIMDVFQTNE